jgi:cytochrome oxidase assembly protein ShyY1
VTSTVVKLRPAAYRPRRIALTVIVVLAAMVLGVIAGAWQWGRYEARAEALAGQAAAEGKPVANLEDLIDPGALEPGAAQWRTATVTGVLDPASLTELRGRSIDNTASLQYLAWIHTQTGRSVLVNLGWQPRTGATPPTLPGEPVTVTGIVRAFEEDNGKPGTRINPLQMSGIDGEVVQGYLMARSTCGASGRASSLEPVPTPSLSLGPHVSYALQWWLLAAVAAPLGIGITRRDAHHEREREAAAAGAPSPRKPPKAPKVPKQGRSPTDEEIEDAL